MGIIVSGYYTRNDSADNTIIDVAQPVTSDFITGGGFLVLSSSSGQLPGDPGSKTSFVFNVKYVQSGASLQGSASITLQSGGHVCQVTSSAILSLGVKNNQASFTGKASIQDMTDPQNVILITSDATLQLSLTDNGNPGTGDTLGIQVLNKSGGVWFSSDWNGVKTLEQNLGGGNLAVH